VVATIGDIAKKLAEVRSKLANGDCLCHTLSVPSCVHARKRPLRRRECRIAREAVATSQARRATIVAIETLLTGIYLAVLGIGRQVLSAS
jgi:hypothetical protein